MEEVVGFLVLLLLFILSCLNCFFVIKMYLGRVKILEAMVSQLEATKKISDFIIDIDADIKEMKCDMDAIRTNEILTIKKNNWGNIRSAFTPQKKVENE